MVKKKYLSEIKAEQEKKRDEEQFIEEEMLDPF